MTLRVAIQMDPIERIAVRTDTTHALMLEGQKRGHTLFYYTPADLAMHDGKILARASPISVANNAANYYSLGDRSILDLATCDVVHLRQDPPFDMHYITTTYLLERLQPGVLVVNDPVEVRNAPEKLLVTRFPQLTPPTLVTRSLEDVRAFRSQHGDIIIKPLYGKGGSAVFRLQPGDTNMASLVELFQSVFPEPFVVQRYQPEVRDGDKRIILVDGEIAGALNRIPAADDTRSNLRAGGRPEPTEITARDREICATIGPELRKRGLILAGIDVIGPYLTEINITSPTGLRDIERLGGPNITPVIWDAIEARINAARA